MKIKFTIASLLLGTTVMLQAAPISRSQARLLAQQFIGISDASTDDVPLSPFYVFSRGTGLGYVIVSGDDATTPIIGYTEQGDYIESLLPPPLRSLLDGWANRLEEVQARQIVTPRRSPVQRLARAVAAYKADWHDVPALVQTHWHQEAPYNGLAPMKNGRHVMTGCVATAGSQVTYYFHKDNPDTLAYATPTYGYGTPVTVSLPAGTPVEWDKMKLSGSGTAAQNNAVATLMYALGTSAWLTYGEGDGYSTSGHNYKMADAMRGQFFLNSTHIDKSGYSQQAWEERIYNNLKTRRPMLYSGVHPSNGGHSVVLDGYQAATGLFHFNFGWGGQGDGWYTVDDETGMNGFNTYQDLVCDITPQKQNLHGELSVATLYHRAPNDVSALVANHGTLDYEGFFLYTNTSAKLPNAYVAKNGATVAATGQQTAVDFTVTPSNQRTKYIFLCDAARNILDSCRVNIVPTRSDLVLNSIDVDAGTQTVVQDGMTFKMVNNTVARINISLTNGPEGTYCYPSVKCVLESYNPEQQTWTAINRLAMSQLFREDETCSLLFSFGNLKPGTLYRAYLMPEAETSTVDEIAMGTTDTMAYFTVSEPDFAATCDGRHAVMKGLWDATLFQQTASNSYVCSFDISELRQVVARQLQAANPNALFYATAAQAEALQGVANVVIDGVCPQLAIHTKADFKPSAPFVATRARLVVDDAVPGKWVPTLVPFAAKAPYGMMLKAPASASNSTVAHQHALQVDPMTPVVFLTSCDTLNTIEADQVAIATDTLASLFAGKLLASTVAMAVEADWYLLDYSGSLLYYLPASEVAADTVRFQSVLTTSRQKRVSTTPAAAIAADQAYAELAATAADAFRVMAANPGAPLASLQDLQTAVKAAQDMISYRSTEAVDEVEACNVLLQQAIARFLEAVATGIDSPDVSREAAQKGTVQYFNLAGQRLDGRRRGIVVRRQGNQVKKVIIK